MGTTVSPCTCRRLPKCAHRCFARWLLTHLVRAWSVHQLQVEGEQPSAGCRPSPGNADSLPRVCATRKRQQRRRLHRKQACHYIKRRACLMRTVCTQVASSCFLPRDCPTPPLRTFQLSKCSSASKGAACSCSRNSCRVSHASCTPHARTSPPVLGSESWSLASPESSLGHTHRPGGGALG